MKLNEQQQETVDQALRMGFILHNPELLAWNLNGKNLERFKDEMEIILTLGDSLKERGFHGKPSQTEQRIADAMNNASQAIIELNKPMFTALLEVYAKNHINEIITKMRAYERKN